MKVIRKAASGVLLFWALLIGAIAVGMSLDEKELTRKSAIPAFMIFGAPALGAGGWLAWGLRQQHLRERQARLQQVFYQLVKSGDGSVSVLQMAMEARVEGDEAKAYLDRCVREFDGTFDVTDDGGILYQFEIRGLVTILPDGKEDCTS